MQETSNEENFHFPNFNFPVNFGKPKDRIAYWENFLSDEQINFLLNINNWKNSAPATVFGQPDGVNIDHIRKSNVAWLNPECPQTRETLEKILIVAAKVNKEYFGFDLYGGFEPAQLTVYTEQNQGHYDWHLDAGFSSEPIASSYRKLSMSLLLNDPSDFEGGELQIQMGGSPVTLEQKQGRAWFFPSFAMHRVAPITKGIRKSLVLWFAGPDFR